MTEHNTGHELDVTTRPARCTCGRAQFAGSKTFVLARYGVHLNDAIERAEAENARLREERDEWMRRRDAAVEECRHLHQDGKTREQWHLDNCGAMRAVRAVETLAECFEAEARTLGRSLSQLMLRDAAKQIRAALDSPTSHPQQEAEVGARVLRERLDDEMAAKRIAAEAADRFRDVLCEALGHDDENPGDDALVAELRARGGFTGPEPRRWRDFCSALAIVDQIRADALAADTTGEPS